MKSSIAPATPAPESRIDITASATFVPHRHSLSPNHQPVKSPWPPAMISRTGVPPERFAATLRCDNAARSAAASIDSSLSGALLEFSILWALRQDLCFLSQDLATVCRLYQFRSYDIYQSTV